MPATVVLGAQWGDEGKGKLVDQLASTLGWVVRFQGGNNAGHTVVIGDRTIKLHLLPSGITNPEATLILGDGMVIDPWVLQRELDTWADEGGDAPLGNRLFISDRAHIILPYHRIFDGLDTKIGTTGRGIGPTYADKIHRTGLRFGDVLTHEDPMVRATTMAARMNAALSARECEDRIEALDLRDQIEWISTTFGPAVRNTGRMLDHALALEERVLLEGAQGCLLDIDQGTYPYVTSSITSRANATHGAGIHPGHVDRTIGVVKAYTTRVGHGPFPSELEDEVGEHLGRIGHEFGTTTGRPRRCGWLDLVVLRHAHRVNGFDELALTKLDVLGGLERLSIVVAYELDGATVTDLPASAEALERCRPVTLEFEGFEAMDLDAWLDLARAAAQDGTGLEALPKGALAYVRAIEHHLDIPVTSVGVGPDRAATLWARPHQD